ncbi:PAS domain-containing sensor histidine kinase [Ekhidna sp.]|uniref:PAS domain-containing sensor histidine kinase n=1 Tax=Ekhidna sp. TaxID=2608089 RepID=UPI003C7D5F9C
MEKRILELLGDAILVVDKQGKVTDINNSVTNLFGYSKKELLGQKFDMLMPPRYRKNHGTFFLGYQKNPETRSMGRTHERNFIAVDKKGREFYVGISLTYYQPSKNDTLYIAVIRDISPLVDLKNKLQQTNETLEAKNKELEQLAYILSHDLKAPTSASRQLIEYIEENHKQELSEQVAQYMGMLKDRNMKMADLIDGILSYAMAGKVTQDVEEINVSELVHDVAENLNIPAGFKIHSHADDINFMGQKTQLFQLMSNLIGNAVKYHHKDQGSIEIRALKTVDEVEIKVTDDGPGIPKKYHQTVFEMFGTANLKQRADSTGIGLAIVKKIVEQNGGVIKLNPNVKTGTEFIFTIKTM